MEKETKKPKNPPAFAKNATVNNTPNVIDNGQEGMSLRDYFAAKAIQGILASPHLKTLTDQIVKDAYCVADTMLKERDEKRNS